LISVKARRLVHYAPDAGGPKAVYELRFKTSQHRSLVVEVDSANLTQPREVVKKAVNERGIFPAQVDDLCAQIEECRRAVVPDVTRTVITGWRGGEGERAFVTPAATFGPAKSRYEFATAEDHVAPESQVGVVKGDLLGWRRAVGKYLEMSSTGQVLLGAALAAPLLKSAGLSESCIFLLAGRSTSGKSTLLKGVSSFQGSAAPANPGNSDRRFIELAAKHNELLFVVGDLSQCNVPDRRRVIHFLAMDTTSGQGRGVSRAVKKTVPDLHFTTIAALSAEGTSTEIAAGAGVRQLIGETVRCFDLVPGRKGYFDARPKKLKPEIVAQRINDGADQQHGSGLEAWVNWLSGKSVKWLQSRVGKLIDEFVCNVDPKGLLSSVERRAARKFGLLYAGLVLGRKARITRLPKTQLFRSVRRCFRRSMASNAAEAPEAALVALKAALKAPGAVLPSYQGGERVKAAVASNPDWLAIDTKRNGKRMIGLRASAVRKVLGDRRAKVALDKLVQTGCLTSPSGEDRWQKKVPGAGKIRLLELQPEWFDRR
jgi:hypothetical protein